VRRDHRESHGLEPGEGVCMNFIKIGDQHINLSHVRSIAESGGGYILYWMDHKNMSQQADVMKDSVEGKILADLLQK
jgi:hypothetical protein